MLTAAYTIYAIAQFALAIWAFRLYRRRPSAGALALLLPIAAVVYDNAMVAAGSLIGPGALLETLSLPRFVGHALLTPIWVVTAAAFARRAGALAERGVAVERAAWALYGALVVIGLVNSVFLLDYELVRQADLVYLTNAGGLPGPPLPSVLMVLSLIVSGVAVWRRTGWPWMLAGSAFMLAAAALPTEIVGFVVSNSGEVVLAASLVTTESVLQRLETSLQGPG